MGGWFVSVSGHSCSSILVTQIASVVMAVCSRLLLGATPEATFKRLHRKGPDDIL